MAAIGVAAFMIGAAFFAYYGDKYMTKKSTPWDKNPRYDKSNTDTVKAMASKECECMHCESECRFSK